ncbi:hypothetical protein [Lactococcus allomyrinae]|uniref:Ribbon-helix-helix protein, CopG family n=1 Tax=Lactococcus allomyrinae TaxID=2419773 RepID=A0A387BRP6_9LACT|nr:hypothetical protein [Lactococcus allomyrinae]AYG01141.1 hypothetical protein D7I46_08560 [Lactococcus allomyrinae]
MATRDIKIRNLDAKVVAKIDGLARRKGQTREEYLRLLLRRLSEAEVLVQRTNHYEAVERQLIDKLEQYSVQLEEIKRGLEW